MLIRALVLLACFGCATAAPQPNILLIQADDLGYGDLGAYGQSHFETPALDALAAKGIRFTQYYAGSAVCGPSRAALMTGLHTGHAWIRTNGEFPLRDEDITLAEVLQRVGYRTAAIGKWGLGRPGSSGEPSLQGFDLAFGILDHRHAHRQYTDHLWRNGERIAVDPDSDYVNDLFTRETIDFISRDDQRPFFVYLNYTVPHPELRAPEEAVAPFRGRYPEVPYVNPRADAARTLPDSVTLGYRSQAEPNATRAGMIARMDRDIARLVALLESRGIARNTLVMFISDNGPSTESNQAIGYFKSTGGLRGNKRDLYEGGIRVPMIASWPGTIPAGGVSDHVWAHWDVLPTLSELAGTSPPAGLDGMSMARALLGQPQPAHEFLYWEFQEDGFKQAVRMGDWKAVRTGPRAALELYHLGRDPYERNDVAAQRPDELRRIEDYLRTARNDEADWPAGGSRAPRNGVAPAALLGEFTDDYDARYTITAPEWRHASNRFHVIRWDSAGQFLVVRNDSANAGEPGLFSRIDWLLLDDMAPYSWAFCYSAYNAPSADSAARVTVARRETPRTGCGGFPFTRMRRVRGAGVARPG